MKEEIRDATKPAAIIGAKNDPSTFEAKHDESTMMSVFSILLLNSFSSHIHTKWSEANTSHLHILKSKMFFPQRCDFGGTVNGYKQEKYKKTKCKQRERERASEGSTEKPTRTHKHTQTKEVRHHTSRVYTEG